jgi:hypothetical protein
VKIPLNNYEKINKKRILGKKSFLLKMVFISKFFIATAKLKDSKLTVPNHWGVS